MLISSLHGWLQGASGCTGSTSNAAVPSAPHVRSAMAAQTECTAGAMEPAGRAKPADRSILGNASFMAASRGCEEYASSAARRGAALYMQVINGSNARAYVAAHAAKDAGINQRPAAIFGYELRTITIRCTPTSVRLLKHSGYAPLCSKHYVALTLSVDNRHCDCAATFLAAAGFGVWQLVSLQGRPPTRCQAKQQQHNGGPH